MLNIKSIQGYIFIIQNTMGETGQKNEKFRRGEKIKRGKRKEEN